MKKTPITYYGGKQKLADWIISYFPENYKDLHYVEPFAGGLAVLWAKEPSRRESINDTDSRLIDFWKVLSTGDLFRKLEKKLKKLVYSEGLFKEAQKKLKKADKIKSMVDRAYYYFIMSQMSFNNVIEGGSFGWSKSIKKNDALLFHNKVMSFDNFQGRLKAVQLFNRDALFLIERISSPQTFFYLDPPYPDSRQHYYGPDFSIEDFNKLVDLLQRIEGKFLLSFYEKPGMKIPKEWFKVSKETFVAFNIDKHKMKRVENLVMNYKPEKKQLILEV